jgi:glycerol-3-phosphate acyltransferase PlsY
MRADLWLLIVGSYLLGSVPAAYLVSRWVKGIDLRQYGSGTVSGSMVWEHVGPWAFLLVLALDVGKIIVPTWLALHLGFGQPAAAVAGLVAVVGHNWPLYLRLTGGRGVGGFVGMLLVLFPWGALWLVAFLAAGWMLGDSAPWLLASLLTLPLLGRYANGPDLIAPLTGAMIILTLIKRVEANRRPLPPPGPERLKVILRRLYLDRDIANHRDWLDRQPGEPPPESRPEGPEQG